MSSRTYCCLTTIPMTVYQLPSGTCGFRPRPVSSSETDGQPSFLALLVTHLPPDSWRGGRGRWTSFPRMQRRFGLPLRALIPFSAILRPQRPGHYHLVEHHDAVRGGPRRVPATSSPPPWSRPNSSFCNSLHSCQDRSSTLLLPDFPTRRAPRQVEHHQWKSNHLHFKTLRIP